MQHYSDHFSTPIKVDLTALYKSTDDAAASMKKFSEATKQAQALLENLEANQKNWVELKSAPPSNFNVLSKFLPGVNDVVKLPCEPCITAQLNPKGLKLGHVIMHLNDDHKWTRERIADWLDESHDSGKINIEF